LIKNFQSHTRRLIAIKYFKRAVLFIFLLIILTGVYNFCRSNPEGTNYESNKYIIEPGDIEFLYDLTYKTDSGIVVSEQEIFDRIFSLIDRAEKYILLDMFLFNSYTGKEDNVYRKISGELIQRLKARKENVPDIKIDFITDPINIIYGGAESKGLNTLKAAGINIIYTDLHKLRDSNILYSPFWRLFFQWFGNSKGGILPNPFSSKSKGVTLRSYLDMLNFKANHRKIFVADHGNTLKAVITSANLHDGSSAHSNVAFEITGYFANEIIKAERAVARFSGYSLTSFDLPDPKAGNRKDSECKVMLITENMIEKAIIENLNRAQYGDRIDMGVFYLSDRDIVASLVNASKRDTVIRIILDPNKDAFGRQKNGIPNRQTARELIDKSEGRIRVRWYDTHGEQYHSKFVFIEYKDKPSVVILGSANFTRRNIDNYNLELDICYTAPNDNRIVGEVRQYYNKLWNSNYYTAEYSRYEDNSEWKMFLARFLESTGASTF